MSNIKLRRNKVPKLNRRSFLAGSGVAMSLPLLEAMLPAGKTAFAQSDTPSRMITMFTGNGMLMDAWTPKAAGRAFELSPSLTPLAPFKDKMLVLSGLYNRPALGGRGGHARGSGGFLTCSTIKATAKATDVMAATSMDQIVAQHIGHATKFPALNYALDGGGLDVDPASTRGASDNGLSSAYVKFISWSSPTTQVPNEGDPRRAFDLLFSDGITNNHLRGIAAYDKSVIDSVLGDAKRLEKQVGMKDKEKLQEYLASVRALEAQLDLNAQVETELNAACSAFERPTLEGNYLQKSRIFNDIMVMAFQCDLTRIVTYMFSSGQTNRRYSHLGVRSGHHGVSRAAHNNANQEALKKIDKYHNEELADLCSKLNATIDVTGKALLDSTVVYRGSEFRDNVQQGQFDLPVVLVGSCNGYFNTGQHINYAEPSIAGSKLASLYLSMMDAMGAPQSKFGNSNQKLQSVKV